MSLFRHPARRRRGWSCPRPRPRSLSILHPWSIAPYSGGGGGGGGRAQLLDALPRRLLALRRLHVRAPDLEPRAVLARLRLAALHPPRVARVARPPARGGGGGRGRGGACCACCSLLTLRRGPCLLCTLRCGTGARAGGGSRGRGGRRVLRSRRTSTSGAALLLRRIPLPLPIAIRVRIPLPPCCCSSTRCRSVPVLHVRVRHVRRGGRRLRLSQVSYVVGERQLLSLLLPVLSSQPAPLDRPATAAVGSRHPAARRSQNRSAAVQALLEPLDSSSSRSGSGSDSGCSTQRPASKMRGELGPA